MKVLLVTDIFPPDIGGPATFIDAVAHAIGQESVKATVVCMSDAVAEQTDSRRPFDVSRTWRSHPKAGQRVFLNLMEGFWLHDNILVNGLEFLSFQAAERMGRDYILKIVGDYVWEAARNSGMTTLSIDEFQSYSSDHPWFSERFQQRRKYLRRARQIIVPSNYLRGLVSGWGVPDHKIHVIHNGTDLGRYAGSAPKRRVAGPLHIAFCGRLVSWKGVDTLLHAAAQMRNIRITIFGDGPERGSLQALSEVLGLNDSVCFAGVLHGDLLRKALGECHVLVLDSQYEGLSHTLIEAGGLGLCRIASSCGGNPEIIKDRVDGLLVPYGGIEELRAVLDQLQNDEDLRFSLAANGQISVARFDLERTVKNTLEILSANAIQPESVHAKHRKLSVTHIINLGEIPGQAPFSGAENHLFVLMTALVKEGIEVELLPLITSDGPSLDPWFKDLEKAGVRVIPIPYEGTDDRDREKRTIAKLRNILTLRRSHIIHTHLEIADYVGRIAAQLAMCPMIVSSVHNNEPFHSDPVWRRQLQTLDYFTSRYVAISDSVRDHLIEVVGLPPDKITTIQYGLMTTLSSNGIRLEIRRRYGIPSQKFVVGFVGRLHPQKNLPVLISALRNLPECHGVIVGAGFLQDQLEGFVRQNRMTNVQFLGYQPKAIELISSFDVFCLPSLWEGLGLVLLEAMLQKVPIIGSRAGAIPDVLGHGQFGFLFNPLSADELTTQLALVRGNPELACRKAEDAFQHATCNFQIEKMVVKTIALYRKVYDETETASSSTSATTNEYRIMGFSLSKAVKAQPCLEKSVQRVNRYLSESKTLLAVKILRKELGHLEETSQILARIDVEP